MHRGDRKEAGEQEPQAWVPSGFAKAHGELFSLEDRRSPGGSE